MESSVRAGNLERAKNMERRTQIKICGLTRIEESSYLNEIQAEYAGFVFWENSRRNVDFHQAREIRKRLRDTIKCVAVTVSPDLELLRTMEQEGFDIIQIHGSLQEEVLEKSSIPVWQACNLKEPGDLKKLVRNEKIAGYVLDAGTAGSGRTFDWEGSKAAVEQARAAYFTDQLLILAGGLHPGNVSQAVEIFSPDVVDVSSGVEGAEGKDRRLVIEFAGKVRRNEKE